MTSRRCSFNRGQWQVARERFGIDAAFPVPPLRDSSPLGNVVDGVMKRLGLAEERWLSVLGAEWQAIVGESVARHTRPGRVDKQTLTVFVDSSMWLSELSRFGKTALMANLQARFGANRLQSVRFQLDPDRSG